MQWNFLECVLCGQHIYRTLAYHVDKLLLLDAYMWWLKLSRMQGAVIWCTWLQRCFRMEYFSLNITVEGKSKIWIKTTGCRGLAQLYPIKICWVFFFDSIFGKNIEPNTLWLPVKLMIPAKFRTVFSLKRQCLFPNIVSHTVIVNCHVTSFAHKFVSFRSLIFCGMGNWIPRNIN